MPPNNLGTGVGNCPPALYINLYGTERGEKSLWREGKEIKVETCQNTHRQAKHVWDRSAEKRVNKKDLSVNIISQNI